MKIFLIRHGEQQYPYNAQGKKMVSGTDAPLVELGRRQMQELRKKLDEEGQVFDAFYRSPLLRAEQSTKELTDGQSIPIHVVDGLTEGFPNSGEGRTYDELEEIGGDVYAHPFSENQESLAHLVDRSRAAIEFILSDAQEHGYESIGIVGHGDPLCALDWCLKHSRNPSLYAEMQTSFYPQKGQAVEYILNSSLELEGEGRVITTEAAKQTIEGFRNPNKEVQ
ncbi:histidine phosphatase family protein [Patescibacteria group bacterium]|nr:histidine phosphatase family protein [Patescibacteria group bacterium]